MIRFRSVATVALVCIVLALSGCVTSGTSSGGSPKITTTSIPSTATAGSPYTGATYGRMEFWCFTSQTVI